MVGFGIPMSWDMADRDEGGHLTVQGMVFRVSQSILLRSRTPKWAYNLGIKSVSECDEAYTAFEKFMVERIAAREDELRKLQSLEEGGGDINEGIKDVFGRLVNARLSDGKLALNDSEIIGNCFILVFAGHGAAHSQIHALPFLILAQKPRRTRYRPPWLYLLYFRKRKSGSTLPSKGYSGIEIQ